MFRLRSLIKLVLCILTLALVKRDIYRRYASFLDQINFEHFEIKLFCPLKVKQGQTVHRGEVVDKKGSIRTQKQTNKTRN